MKIVVHNYLIIIQDLKNIQSKTKKTPIYILHLEDYIIIMSV